MNKTELVAAISEKTNGTKKEAELYLSSILSIIADALVDGEEVNLTGFGKFSVADVPERRGTVQLGSNKGSEYITPAHVKPCFKFGKAVKDAVKGE